MRWCGAGTATATLRLIIMMGHDIFTGKQYEDISPTSYTVCEPFVKRTESLSISMDCGGYCSLMTLNPDPSTPAKHEFCRVPENRMREDIVRESKALAEEYPLIATVILACCYHCYGHGSHH